MAFIKVEEFVQDPNEKLDYGFDWTKPLATDTISASTWVVPVGVTQSVTPPPSFDDTTTRIYLEGGTPNTNYTLVNRITTTVGRIFEASFTLQVRDSD